MNQPKQARELSEPEIIRREALGELRALGIDPYPARAFDVNTSVREIQENYSEENQEKFQDISLSGRIMMKRVMGKASFAELKASTGTIQIYSRLGDVGPGEDQTM